MIRELPESEGAVIGCEITGKVSLEQEKEWIEKIDKVIEEHGKVRVLVVLGDEASWGVKAGIEDLKWIVNNMKKLGKIAVVSENHIWKWLIALDSPIAKLVGINEKYFELSDIDDAWKWLRE